MRRATARRPDVESAQETAAVDTPAGAVDPWPVYEGVKAQLRAMDLTPDEYEQALRAICAAMEI